eukprot:comp20063_c0_seq1/m.24670 comp20063_c0_seq1/g.24670  ORF comp20063_c0_seq1/g.24670 comp20063_c0_seq1/m.24670 type:complete len:759 (-) comp20063_c0_seq1:518-2794(-)
MASVLEPLEYAEAEYDSPKLRLRLDTYENSARKVLGQLKGFKEAWEVYCTHQRNAMQAHLVCANILRDTQIPVIGQMTDDEKLLSDSAGQFSGMLDDLEVLREENMLMQFEAVGKQVEAFVADLTGRLQKDSDTFRAASEHYYRELTSQLPKKTLDNGALERDREVLFESQIAYMEALTDIQARLRSNVPELVLLYMKSEFNFLKQASMSLGDHQAYFNLLQQKLYEANQEQDEIKTLSADLHTKHLQRFKKRHTQHMILNTKEGLVLMLVKRSMTKDWVPMHGVFNKEGRVLELQPMRGTQGGAAGTSSLLKGKDQGVVIMTVVSSLLLRGEVDSQAYGRMNCFEVMGDSGTKIVLQAPTSQELAEWTTVMGLDQPSVATGHRDSRKEDPPPDLAKSTGSKFGVTGLDKSAVVVDIIELLENPADNLDAEGIYRVPGGKARVERALETYMKNPSTGLTMLKEECDVPTLASVLKLYLRELPDPLMTHAKYDAFFQASKIEDQDERAMAVLELIDDLPPDNRRLLQILCQHLTKVAARAEHNKMQAANLGVCLAPSILRAKIEDMSDIYNMKYLNGILTMLIEQYDFFFGNEGPHGRRPSQTEAPPSPSAPATAPPIPVRQNHVNSASRQRLTERRTWYNTQSTRRRPAPPMPEAGRLRSKQSRAALDTRHMPQPPTSPTGGDGTAAVSVGASGVARASASSAFEQGQASPSRPPPPLPQRLSKQQQGDQAAKPAPQSGPATPARTGGKLAVRWPPES